MLIGKSTINGPFSIAFCMFTLPVTGEFRIATGQERTGREEVLNFVSYNLFAFPYAWAAIWEMSEVLILILMCNLGDQNNKYLQELMLI